MSAEIVNVANGIITLKISGKLSQPDLAAVQGSVAKIFRQQGKMRILVLAEDFQGWEKEGDWGDLSSMLENDQFMERMAIVGEKRWKELGLVFAVKGFRDCLVEYFQPEEIVRAWAWLAEDR
ncbi:MAG: STAS/SEC14 domain-containing protein [Nitrospiraceae bacterium]|nr:STAS/SEC14 domain-containing protein [Nitrospiraceae bacterium]